MSRFVGKFVRDGKVLIIIIKNEYIWEANVLGNDKVIKGNSFIDTRRKAILVANECGWGIDA